MHTSPFRLALIAVTICLHLGCSQAASSSSAAPAAPPAVDSGGKEFQRLAERLQVLRQRQDWPRALETLQKMKAADPNHPATWYALGEIYGADGAHFDQAKALAAFERFLDVATEPRLADLRTKVNGFILDLEDGKRLPALPGGEAASAAPSSGNRPVGNPAAVAPPTTGGTALNPAEELEWRTMEMLTRDLQSSKDVDQRKAKQAEIIQRLKKFCDRNPDYLPGWMVMATLALDQPNASAAHQAGAQLQRLAAAGSTHPGLVDMLAAINARGWLKSDPSVIDLGGGVKLELVWCPPGTFMMGSPSGEDDRSPDETQHRVTLTKGFWLGKYEVTQAQWRAVMGDNPSHFKNAGDDAPVEKISWEDAQTFMGRLNQRGAGGVFRLPTEAEWEYACRAGSTGPYAGSLNEMGWYEDNSGERTHPVGRKKPNAWGLYDMHGNVWEWCQDWHDDYPWGNAADPAGPGSGSIRVLRGGCWDRSASSCRSASRGWNEPGFRHDNLGLRLLRAD